MKYYKLKSRIIHLPSIRDITYIGKELYIQFQNGDTRTERIVFSSEDELETVVEDIYKALQEDSIIAPSREEAISPGTYTPTETKCDTGENKAFWDFSVSGYAKCSSCKRSFEALPAVFMFKENNKFCRMCGKAMEVRNED